VKQLLHSAPLILICLPCVFGQTAPPNKPDLLDTILVMAGTSEPVDMTAKQKFRNYLLSIGGPAPLIAEAASAGLSQWGNNPREWGQGWGAYGQRFGSALAYNGIRQSILYGLSVPLHEDCRYFPSKAHGFFPRAGHALVSGFIAKHPDGRQRFSFSDIAAVGGAAAISSMWGPSSWKGAGNIAQTAGVSFASTAAFNVFREFAPDILHRPRR